MQSFSSRIWTRVAVSISYDDNHYTTGTSLGVYACIIIIIMYIINIIISISCLKLFNYEQTNDWY